MVEEPIYNDRGCQELQNEHKNVEIGLRMKKLRTKQRLPRLLDFGRPSGFGRPKKVGFRTSEKGRTSDAGSNLLRRKCRKSENFRTSEKGVGWSRDLSPKLDFGRKI